MVQKGKFSAAAVLLVRTLKNVDFLKRPKNNGVQIMDIQGFCSTYTNPTFGRPTIPTLRDVPTLPRRGAGPEASDLPLALLILLLNK